jgi:hypothetical protein
MQRITLFLQYFPNTYLPQDKEAFLKTKKLRLPTHLDQHSSGLLLVAALLQLLACQVATRSCLQHNCCLLFNAELAATTAGCCCY